MENIFIFSNKDILEKMQLNIQNVCKSQNTVSIHLGECKTRATIPVTI